MVRIVGHMFGFMKNGTFFNPKGTKIDWLIMPSELLRRACSIRDTTSQETKYGRKTSDCDTRLTKLFRTSLIITARNTANSWVKKMNRTFK